MRLRFALTAAVATLALPGATAHAGSSNAGYSYTSCGGIEAPCAYTGRTDAQSKSASIGGAAFCPTGLVALNKLGSVKLTNGRRSLVRTLRVRAPGGGGIRAVRVSLTLKVRTGKSLSGSVKLTTRARDCASQSGRVQRFSMRYVRRV